VRRCVLQQVGQPLEQRVVRWQIDFATQLRVLVRFVATVEAAIGQGQRVMDARGVRRGR
jgi:hypothetical protein